MPATRATNQPKDSHPGSHDTTQDTKRQQRTKTAPEVQPTKRTSTRILENESSKAKQASSPTVKDAPKASRVTGNPSQATIINDLGALDIKGASSGSKRKASRVVEPKAIVMVNPLSVQFDHRRPCLHLFVWGAGDAGQLAMGPDFCSELNKPRKSSFVEDGIDREIFGEDEAGLETIAAGGLQTLFIDERGTVSCDCYL